MPADYCAHCKLYWPTDTEDCPRCDKGTKRYDHTPPMPKERYERVIRECFYDYYERREEGREGPSPEELGRKDAKEILELEGFMAQPAE